MTAAELVFIGCCSRHPHLLEQFRAFGEHQARPLPVSVPDLQEQLPACLPEFAASLPAIPRAAGCGAHRQQQTPAVHSARHAFRIMCLWLPVCCAQLRLSLQPHHLCEQSEACRQSKLSAEMQSTLSRCFRRAPILTHICVCTHLRKLFRSSNTSLDCQEAQQLRAPALKSPWHAPANTPHTGKVCDCAKDENEPSHQYRCTHTCAVCTKQKKNREIRCWLPPSIEPQQAAVPAPLRSTTSRQCDVNPARGILTNCNKKH